MVSKVGGLIGAAAGAALIGSILLAPTASATPAHAGTAAEFFCGYQGYDEGLANQPGYRHCESNTYVQIQVSHIIGHDTYFCARPGLQRVPGGDNNKWINGAAATGRLC
jgi:hypothetical protein